MNTVIETDEGGHWALSPEQRALLVPAAEHGEQAPEPPRRNRVLVVDVTGDLDANALETALERVTDAHEALHTGIRAVPGFRGLRHQVLGMCSRPQWWHEDLRGAGAPEAALAQRIDALAGGPLRMDDGELLRPALFRVGESSHVLVLAVTPLAADLRSLQRLITGLVAAYRQPDGDPESEETLQYSQFVEWRAAIADDEDAPAGRAYWQRHLEPMQGAGAPRLFCRRPGGVAVPVTHECVGGVLHADTLAQLDALAQARQVTFEAVAQAVWWALLARLGGSYRFIGGWQHDCRRDYEVMDGAVGVFDKVLPVAVDLSPSTTFTGWIDRLAAQLEAHTEAQEYWPVDEPPDTRHLAVGFELADAVEPLGSHPAWRVRGLPGPLVGFELAARVTRGEHGGDIAVYVDPEHYSRATAESLLGQYRTLLDRVAEEPEQSLTAPTLSDGSSGGAPAVMHGATADFGTGTVADHIATWAERTPDAPAVRDGERSLGYEQLQEQVAGLARWLGAQGIGPGDLVALAIPRSTELIVSLLAIWRVGAGYLPLDLDWPRERRDTVLDDARAAMVLHVGDSMAGESSIDGVRSTNLAEIDVEAFAHEPLPASATLRDTAYVLYTSGSTGVPKGVVIEHAQLLNYVAAATETMGLAGSRRWALTSSVATDLGNTALFGALFNGAELVIAGEQTMQHAAAFARFIDTYGIDAAKIVPSHLEALLDADAPTLPQKLVLGGEGASRTLIERIAEIAPGSEVYNHYGPTETAVGIMIHPLTAVCEPSPLPLTRVLSNCRCYVLDESGRPAPPGGLGELCIAGAQVCRGYLNGRGDDAFMDDPFQRGERVYRTGDLAGVLPEGGIRLVGRTDHQVKVRGFRIEPAEVEAALLAQPGVRLAAVHPVADRGAEPELVAFVVLGEDAALAGGEQALRDALAERLPSPMLPARFVYVDAFPRLANGKIDLAALASLAAGDDSHGPATPPRDDLEWVLCQAMAEVLGCGEVGIHDDFFELGGHSLVAIKLVARIRRFLDVEIEPGTVFDHPNVAALGEALRNGDHDIGEMERHAALRREQGVDSADGIDVREAGARSTPVPESTDES
ncbi:non-ribosomal peptide synthetase [Arhodomonas sp. AD133]|uniref:non-ribosomal peptide synthetase n=1 Tax=Arhodomonas sp. AD133 TaxID=3415009 RepID=UPI003EBE6751